MDTSSVTLVVDDDAVARFLTCRLLRQEQVPGRVLEASNGQQALEVLQELCASTQPPLSVLVLVDINMPVMNGLEFLRQQQALPALHCQVMTTVVVSSSAAEADRERAQALASAYVTKPLTQSVLHQLVQQHLASSGLGCASGQ
ncbi:response regulator [Hymenobacter bucti]|uniref:Response regulator n=1 Tax=Hymenobacter bucti TaxID=1844114 RepID=A0ABW4QNH9_9BACT